MERGIAADHSRPVSLECGLADSRWFCNAVTDSVEEDASVPGQTYLVEGGRLRLLQGVAEYEEHMESKVRKRIGAL